MKKFSRHPPMDYSRPRGGGDSALARAAAENIIAAVTNRYNDCVEDYESDDTRYGADIDMWNQRAGVILSHSASDYVNCYTALLQAYNALATEASRVGSASAKIDTANDLVSQGDALTDPNKTPKYDSASNTASSADVDCGQGETAHADTDGYLTTAEGILVNYG